MIIKKNIKLKKLNKVLINLIIYFFNKISLILIDKFFHSKNLFIVFLREDRIGHQASNTDREFYKALMKKRRDKLKTIFVFPYPEENIANKYF